MKRLTKNIKRVSYFALALVLAIASIFTFIPRKSKVAQAASNDTTTVILDNFTINLNFIEYLSASLKNACYTVDNCYMTLRFGGDWYDISYNYSTILRNQDTYQDYTYQGSFSITDYLPAISNENGGYGWNFFTRFYRDENGPGYSYTAPTTNLSAAYNIIRPVGNAEDPQYYLARLTDYIGTNANAVAYFQLLDPNALFSTNNRDILYAHRVYRVGTPQAISYYSNLILDYSGYAIGYEAYVAGLNERRLIYSPTLKLTFCGSEGMSNAVVFEFPCNYGIKPFVASYSIVEGFVDVNSASYINGYNAGYNAGYTENYQTIYDEGYRVGESAGYNRGYEKGAEANTTFLNFFTSIVDAPIKVFTELFDFQILGVNLTEFFLSILSLCIIITVIRWFV